MAGALGYELSEFGDASQSGQAGVKLSMPLLFRKERGRAGEARAQAAEQRESLRLVVDQLRDVNHAVDR